MTPGRARQQMSGLQYVTTATPVPDEAAVVVPDLVDLAEPDASPAQPKSASLPHDAEHLALRLGLQRRASSNIRRHLLRHLRRVSVLLVADFVAVAGLDLIFASLLASGAGFLGSFLQLQLASPRYLVALGVGLYVAGNYSSGDDRRSAHRLLYGVFLAMLLEMWTVVWAGGVTQQVLVLVAAAGLVWLALVFERTMVDRVVAAFSSGQKHAARTIFVGPAEMCREAAAYPALNVANAFACLGFLDVRKPASPDALGGVDDLARTLHDLRIETVVVCGYLPNLQLQALVSVALAAGCHILTVPRAIEVAGVHPTVIWSHGVPLMELSAPALRGQQRLLKRIIDVVGSVIGLVLTSPLMVLAALAIKLDSRGPVFFRQVRVGVGGKRFRVWKFRTMTHNAPDTLHREYMTRMLGGDEASTLRRDGNGRPVFKMVEDPRVTRVGRFLRKSSLDELPQFFNVLRGEMSLVGPRPPVPYEFDAYDHWQYDRMQVRPGITGLWQVSGRSRLSYRQMCELDVDYVRRWSVWLDLRILLRTVPVVLFNSGRAV
jgi:exopolysaccharide biosynthesis polyprenyl glycosylphosphotransferase